MGLCPWDDGVSPLPIVPAQMYACDLSISSQNGVVGQEVTTELAQRTKMVQYGALPILIDDGQLRVLLITSRETRRWIIPKGWPVKKLSPSAVAAREAFEEAGLEGRVADRPLAVFSYVKRLKSGRCVTCQVETYLFEVDRELDDWPEKYQRERRWVSPDEAARLVSDAGLGDVLRELVR